MPSNRLLQPIKALLKAVADPVLRAKVEELHARVLELNHLYHHGKEGLRHTWHPPGHFYSPYPNLDELRAREDRVFALPEPGNLPGVDLREAAQLALFQELADLCKDHSFPEKATPPLRYYFENPAYSYGDALILHGMLRRFKPRRVVEIGSGYSSCMTLDTVDRHLAGQTTCTFVEPYPELLLSLVPERERASLDIRSQPLHEIDLALFRDLAAGDLLFVDSTHVAKTGSDVNRLIFEVFPALAPGVLVHVHDIFYPFEYPRAWVFEGRGWNEAYLLRAFLSFNRTFEIVLWSDFLAKFHRDRAEALMPLWGRNTGGNFWLRKVATS